MSSLDNPMQKMNNYLQHQQRSKNNSCISSSALNQGTLMRERMHSMDTNQQQQLNTVSSVDNSKGLILNMQPSSYKKNKTRQNQLSYTFGQTLNKQANGKVNSYQSPTYSYSSQKNSYSSIHNQLQQKPLVSNSSCDQSSKKQEIRTNSSHIIQQNITPQQQNGLVIQNLIQSIDNSKSTDTSPIQRTNSNSNGSSNTNQYISSLNLNKNLSQQLNNSKSLLSSSINNPMFIGAQTISSGSSSSKHNQNSISLSTNLFTQQNSYLNNLQLFQQYQKDGYLTNNQIIHHQSPPIFNQQKTMSATLPKNNAIFQSPGKKNDSINGVNFLNHNYVSSSQKAHTEANRSINNGKPYSEQKQPKDKDERMYTIQSPLEPPSSEIIKSKIYIQTINQQRQQYYININNVEYSIDMSSNTQSQYQRQQIANQDDKLIDVQITSSNVTDDEGAKLFTLESGSLKSQNQSLQQQAYNQNIIISEKETKIIQLEKEKFDLYDKVKNYEIQLESNKNLLQTQIELEKYKIKEYYENQQKEIIEKMKEEFKQKEQNIRQQIQQDHQKEKDMYIQKDKILESLQSVMSQNDQLFQQQKWLQEKLTESEVNKEDKIQSDVFKSEKFTISIENITPVRNQSPSFQGNSTIKKLYTQSNSHDDKNQQKDSVAEVITEEDVNTGTNSEKVKKSKKTSDFQASNNDSDKGLSELDSIANINLQGGFQDRLNMNDKNWGDDNTSNNVSPNKKRANRNGSLIFTQETRIEEFERIIGVKNHEIQDLKEKLYEAKNFLIQQIPNPSQKINIPVVQSQEHYPQKRRKSCSSSTDLLHSFSHQNAIKKQFLEISLFKYFYECIIYFLKGKPIQNSIMEWSYSFDCSGSVEKLLEDGWKITEHHSQVDLQDLNQVIGVIGLPKTGKTTIINGLMKGNLQTVEELQKQAFFEPKLNIVLDENIAIFEYSYMQPIQIDNPITNISVSSIAELSQQKQYSQIIQTKLYNLNLNYIIHSKRNYFFNLKVEEQIQKTNKRDFFWIDFFIKNTQTLLVVFDKFTQEEQKMLSEILNRIENEDDLYTKDKGLKSAEELQGYFGESLQHIDTNFKQKSMVELKMYRTVLIQKNTKSKKCIHISHILNGNLFEPFADKYQHNMLQYCMNKLSQINQSSKQFMQTFESFLQKNLPLYLIQNNISSFQQIDNLLFDSENSSLAFKQQQQQSQ